MASKPNMRQAFIFPVAVFAWLANVGVNSIAYSAEVSAPALHIKAIGEHDQAKSVSTMSRERGLANTEPIAQLTFSKYFPPQSIHEELLFHKCFYST